MPGLRDEITKTLRRFSKGVSSRSPAGSRSGKQPSAAESALREERKLGSYRILKHLGAGGMGHVYLALDTRLGRHVALKFLSPDLTADEEMLRRLEVEAQTASRLNHPNILTIYDIGYLEGEYYIASEYVDGATLRSAIERNVLDPVTAINVAGQVLSALVAAHSAGVVHRDLKPGNIMIRPDGYVKVIDFGLAKQTGDSKKGSRLDDTITSPGSIIGTIDYMSPEQANGDIVDQRTDLWSVGVILYETLTNQRPFEGDTEHHVFVNILEKPVPLLPERPDVPAGISQVVQKALKRKREERYQTARDMLADLQAVQQSSQIESHISKVAASVRSRSAKPTIVFTLLLAGLVALLAGGWFFYKIDRFFPKLTRLEAIRQLTFDDRIQIAAISPDGRYLAYATGDVGGLQTLCLKQVDSSSEGTVKIPSRRINYVGLTFSPDNQSIFEVEEDETLYRKLYVVPLIGPVPDRPVLVDIDGPVSFSPNGQQFAFTRFRHRMNGTLPQTESNVYIASREGQIIRKLFSSVSELLRPRLAWSPRDNQIAVLLKKNVSDVNGQTTFDLLDMAGHRTEWSLPNWHEIGQPVWTTDGKSILLSASTNTESNDQSQIRQIDVGTGSDHVITKELFGFDSISGTVDGKYLAAIRLEAKARIWISAANDFRRGTSGSAEPEQKYPDLDWSDEQHLLINSKRSGYPNFWSFDILTQTLSRLTDERFVNQSAAAVPGGRFVVFTSNRSGQFHIWRLDTSTNQLVQLTSGPDYDQFPVATPDGRWVLYSSWHANLPYLRKVPVEGGVSVPIGSYLAEKLSVSPDGKSIACLLHDPVKLNAMAAIVDMNGTAPPHVLPGIRMPLRWLPRQNQLASVRTDIRGVSNLWTVPLDNSDAHQITDFDDQTILDFQWSPNGTRLACLRASLGRDVILLGASRQR